MFVKFGYSLKYAKDLYRSYRLVVCVLCTILFYCIFFQIYFLLDTSLYMLSFTLKPLASHIQIPARLYTLDRGGNSCVHHLAHASFVCLYYQFGVVRVWMSLNAHQ